LIFVAGSLFPSRSSHPRAAPQFSTIEANPARKSFDRGGDKQEKSADPRAKLGPCCSAKQARKRR